MQSCSQTTGGYSRLSQRKTDVCVGHPITPCCKHGLKSPHSKSTLLAQFVRGSTTPLGAACDHRAHGGYAGCARRRRPVIRAQEKERMRYMSWRGYGAAGPRSDRRAERSGEACGGVPSEASGSRSPRARPCHTECNTGTGASSFASCGVKSRLFRGWHRGVATQAARSRQAGRGRLFATQSAHERMSAGRRLPYVLMQRQKVSASRGRGRCSADDKAADIRPESPRRRFASEPAVTVTGTSQAPHACRYIIFGRPALSRLALARPVAARHQCCAPAFASWRPQPAPARRMCSEAPSTC